jgi:hypothetical protein
MNSTAKSAFDPSLIPGTNLSIKKWCERVFTTDRQVWTGIYTLSFRPILFSEAYGRVRWSANCTHAS